MIGGASSTGEPSLSHDRQGHSREWAMFLEAAAAGKSKLLGDYITAWNRSQIITQWKNEHGMSALHLSALGGHLSCARRLLSELAPADSDDLQKATPLMFAALGGHIKVLDLLIRNGALLGRTDANGRTALFYGVTGSQRPLVRHLLQKWRSGCKEFVRHMDMHGCSALYYALNQYDLKMASMLIEHGAPVDGHWLCEASLPLIERKTALMYAAECNDLEFLGYCLQKGADPNAVMRTRMPPPVRPAKNAELERVAALADRIRPLKGLRGKTALMFAAENASLACVDALLRLPPDNCAELNAQDEYGATPLMYAITAGSEEIIELLLRRGADPTIQDVQAMSSLSIALCRGSVSPRVLELLVNFSCPGYKPGIKLHDPLYARTPWTTVYLLGLGASGLPPMPQMPPAVHPPATAQPRSPPRNESSGSLNAFHLSGGVSERSNQVPVEVKSEGGSLSTNCGLAELSGAQAALACQVADALGVLIAMNALPNLSRPAAMSHPISASLQAVLELPAVLRQHQSEQRLMPPPPPKLAVVAQPTGLERAASMRIGVWRPEEPEEGPLDPFFERD